MAREVTVVIRPTRMALREFHHTCCNGTMGIAMPAGVAYRYFGTLHSRLCGGRAPAHEHEPKSVMGASVSVRVSPDDGR